MITIEKAIYGHLRFALRRLGQDMDSATVRKLAHAVCGFFEMTDQVVVTRKYAFFAQSWAEEALAELPEEYRPSLDVLPDIENALASLSVEIGERPVRCDELDCPYHRLANHTQELKNERPQG